jgi:hypothetical protein
MQNCRKISVLETRTRIYRASEKSFNKSFFVHEIQESKESANSLDSLTSSEHLVCVILCVLEFNYTVCVLCIIFGLLGFLKDSEFTEFSQCWVQIDLFGFSHLQTNTYLPCVVSLNLDPVDSYTSYIILKQKEKNYNQ